MTCCGLERDSQFCPKCGKLLAPFNTDPPRWACAARNADNVITITIYPDRHRVAVHRMISFGEAKLLRDELTEIIGV